MKWINVSKSELKVFAILLLSVKSSPFLFDAIFDSPKECLFEKYGLQLFQSGFEPFSRFKLSKWSFLHLFLVLVHSFFAFYSLKHLLRFEFCFVFEFRSFHNSYTKFYLYEVFDFLESLNFLWCMFITFI